MPYIGRSSEFAVRTVFTYTPSAGDTSISGNDVDGKPLSFIDGRYAEVYLNGVKLKLDTDYNTNTTNTIAGLAELAASDEVEIVVYDAFTTSDTVSATNGGGFTGSIFSNTAGDNNTNFGRNAGNSITSGGNYNVTIGDESGTAITTGDYNIAVGFEAGKAITTALHSTIIGGLAGDAITSGSNNIAIGHKTLTTETEEIGRASCRERV